MKSVTLITPIFKNAKSLARAFDSVLAQDYEGKIEVIIALDDSGDGSLDIAKDYVAKHPDVFVLLTKEERMGQAKARFEALQIATGDYIGFFDGDDELSPHYLSTLVKALEEAEADVVNSSFFVTKSKNGKRSCFRYPFIHARATVDRAKAFDLFFADASFRGFLWSKLFKRELFFSYPLLLLNHKEDMFEDVAFLTSVLTHVKKVALIPTPLYYYYEDNPDSATSDSRHDRTFRHIAVFALQRHLLETLGLEKERKAFLRQSFRMGLSLGYDKSLDKKGKGCGKDYLRQCDALWKRIKNKNGALDVSDTPLQEIIDRAYYSPESKDS